MDTQMDETTMSLALKLHLGFLDLFTRLLLQDTSFLLSVQGMNIVNACL